jgi:hypothetical protein
MGRTKTKPFLKRKKVPKLFFHFWPPKKCHPFFFLIHTGTWWCENITASPCEQYRPHLKQEMRPGSREGQAVPASYEVPAMLLILSRRDGHHYAQTNANNVNKIEPYYKQLEVKTNWTSFLCGNRNELYRHIIGQHKKRLSTRTPPK